jgi:hypothetical protein
MMDTPFKKTIFGLATAGVICLLTLAGCEDSTDKTKKSPNGTVVASDRMELGGTGSTRSNDDDAYIAFDKRTGCAFIKNYVEGDYVYTALPDPTGKQVGCKQNGAMSLDEYLKINPEVK